ncbi:MAG: M1 family aminopeptidase, partial [Bacteroidota bacterium]
FIFCFEGLAQENNYRHYLRKRYTRRDTLRGALSPERKAFDVFYYDLSVRIPKSRGTIKGGNSIHFIVKNATRRIQLDLYKNMKIDAIYLEGSSEVTALPFSREHHTVYVDFKEALQKDSTYTVRVEYQGIPLSNKWEYQYKGFIWEKDAKYRPWIGVSCEHIGASLWWPNKDHLSDEPDSMRIHLQVPIDQTCISNGVLESTEDIGKERIYHWFVQNPIDNYNVSFILGSYIKSTLPYKNREGDWEIELYTLDYDIKHAKKYFNYAPTALQFFETLFGTYPFWNDKFALVQSPYSGMEHQGCLAIGENLAFYKNWYYAYQVPWHSTLVHEMAHEWWGNSVSISDMADAWLQEGFATYAEMLFIERMLGKEAYEKSVNYLKYFIEYDYPVLGIPGLNDNTF